MKLIRNFLLDIMKEWSVSSQKYTCIEADIYFKYVYIVLVFFYDKYPTKEIVVIFLKFSTVLH